MKKPVSMEWLASEVRLNDLFVILILGTLDLLKQMFEVEMRANTKLRNAISIMLQTRIVIIYYYYYYPIFIQIRGDFFCFQ